MRLHIAGRAVRLASFRAAFLAIGMLASVSWTNADIVQTHPRKEPTYHDPHDHEQPDPDKSIGCCYSAQHASKSEKHGEDANEPRQQPGTRQPDALVGLL